MVGHFPYLSAGMATAVVGTIASLAGLGTHHVTSAWAAQLPAPHPGVTVYPAVVRPVVGGGVLAPPPVMAQPAGVPPNTPGSGPPPLPPGFQQSTAFGSTGMSQAGQPPFGEMFYSLQTYMNQPGQPDYYDRLGINPTMIQASQGATPFTSYQGQVGAQVSATAATTTTTATTPPNSIGQHFTPTNTGNTVGFYNGFGPGAPNWGFFAGFTTPR